MTGQLVGVLNDNTVRYTCDSEGINLLFHAEIIFGSQLCQQNNFDPFMVSFPIIDGPTTVSNAHFVSRVGAM